MNKQELINAVSDATGTGKTDTATAIDAIIASVSQALAAGQTVQLIGFGSFSTGERAERTGRNPATGEEMRIAAARTVKFTAGKAFKERINGM